jgi:hypothetical protein
VDRTGVELLHIDTGSDEIEEAFLRRLEDDRTRGFLRAAAWAATHEPSGGGSISNGNGSLGGPGTGTATRTSMTSAQKGEGTDAGIPGHPSV